MSKECNIIIESDGADDPNWAVWKMSLFTVGEMDAKNIRDMVDKIKEKVKKDKCCIKQLTIMGHGAPGYIEIGEDSINIWDPSTWKPIFNELKGCFCNDARISLAGCSVGADEDGINLLYLIAKNIGVVVDGPTHSINQYYSGPGEQEADPKKPKPEKIPDSSDSKKKKVKPKGKKACMVGHVDGKPKVVNTDKIKGFAIIDPRVSMTRRVIKEQYIAVSDAKGFIDSLDIFDPFCAVDMPFKKQANMYFWLEHEEEDAIPALPPSFLLGGYRHIVFLGDWSHTYRVTGGFHRTLQKLGAYPTSEKAFELYPYLLKTDHSNQQRKS